MALAGISFGGGRETSITQIRSRETTTDGAAERRRPRRPELRLGFLLLPLGAMILGLVAEYSGLDLWLGHRFYDATSGQWSYRSAYLTKVVLHDDAQLLMKGIGVVILGLVVATFVVPRLEPLRRAVGYLLLASVTGPLIVAELKSTVRVQIPWNLAEFGGKMPYVRLFDHVAAGIGPGHAFPSGHSSAGFALFSLYFLFYYRSPALRRLGLLLPLVLGTLFGAAQEMRGAHFLSHDLFSLAICWTSALLWALLLFEPKRGEPE